MNSRVFFQIPTAASSMAEDVELPSLVMGLVYRPDGEDLQREAMLKATHLPR